jgi:hypothetical protein
VKGYEWFGEGKSVADFDPAFKPGSSRRNKTNIGTVVGKPGQNDREISYLGPWTGSGDRGEEYLKFRTWKDQKMTGNLGFSDTELPTFGAMNANWEKTRGTGNATNDVWKKYNKNSGKKMPQAPDSINYYGDVHFVLRKTSVTGRTVYTAGDHGRPHTDPFLVLADFLVGDSANYTASKTGVESKPIKKPWNADVLINAALSGGAFVQDELPFEIQIFGGINITRDVESIHLSGFIMPLVAQRIMALQDKLPDIMITAGNPEDKAPDYLQNIGSHASELHIQVEELMKKSD